MCHWWSNILQRRSNIHSPNFQRSIKVWTRYLILFILLDWWIRNRHFLRILRVEFTNTITHYVHYLLIFGRLFIIFFHDSTEAITKLNKEFWAAALLFWHLHKLCDMYWGAEKLDLITLFALGTDLVLAAEELLPFLHQGRHFLAVHGQNNLYESR